MTASRFDLARSISRLKNRCHHVHDYLHLLDEAIAALLRGSLTTGRIHIIVPEERRRTLNAFQRRADQARDRLGGLQTLVHTMFCDCLRHHDLYDCENLRESAKAERMIARMEYAVQVRDLEARLDTLDEYFYHVIHEFKDEFLSDIVDLCVQDAWDVSPVWLGWDERRRLEREIRETINGWDDDFLLAWVQCSQLDVDLLLGHYRE